MKTSVASLLGLNLPQEMGHQHTTGEMEHWKTHPPDYHSGTLLHPFSKPSEFVSSTTHATVHIVEPFIRHMLECASKGI